MHVVAPKEYVWGSFALWIFPEDTLRVDRGTYRLIVDPKDEVARSHGQRSRRELYWRTEFLVQIPIADLDNGMDYSI